MKVLDPGHAFWLENLNVEAEDRQFQLLQFVKRDTPIEKYPGNVGHYSGTTMQEVLRALISRLQYVGDQVYDPANGLVLRELREAICLLEIRAATRHNRHIHLTTDQRSSIEELPTCSKCGHIFPGMHKECHAAR